MVQPLNLSSIWYEATAKRGALDELPDGRSFDVCVIGGGLAGLTTALELAKTGRSVLLLEAHLIGSGASGRNGGFVSSGFALGYSDLVRKLGREDARALYGLSQRGTEYMRGTIATHQPDIKMGDGWMVALRHNPRGMEEYAETMRHELGEPVSFLPPEVLREKLVSARYHGALHNPSAFHIHPLRYVLLLAALARRAGAMIVENCAASRIEKQGAGFAIHTPRGTVSAQHVVHCVSSLGRSLNNPVHKAVLPVATYIAVTEPLVQDAIRTHAAIADTRRAGDYYRLIDEGRILWGGRITTRVSEPSRLAERMKGDMLSVYPQLGNPRIDYAWAGLMGYAVHKMPIIGRGADGQWHATAFGGHGLNTTAMAGILLARAIADGDEEYRRFKPFGPAFTFGPLGRVGVQASYWWMQVRDKYDESRA
ncbi:NAD(P)/FAD-dependent oxidoreductase [Aestuariivirga litoralis]|uniref:NAD(P)/FAD-dependent oxidoreductase n=1 Tax=Aestuariivirga litoralis TaxID=2650924 RepID=UPI0018C4624B|nr:FAD-binding oxidoreductase [Aestuariivirga litoralis]MBG1233012.1 FAD-binding oxidoreductase [Aestuariivirga litoralis]